MAAHCSHRGHFSCFLGLPRSGDDVVRGEAFNVGQTSENYRVRELAELVGQIVPDCRIEYAADASPDTRCYRVNCDKIACLLPGFQPEWTARMGAAQLYRAMITQGVTVDDFEGTRYKRIAHIKHLISSGVIDTSLRVQQPFAAAAAIPN